MAITREDLVEALGKYYHGENHPDAMTTSELQEVFDLGVESTRKRVRSLVKSGTLEPVWVRRPNVAGIVQKVIAYRLVED